MTSAAPVATNIDKAKAGLSDSILDERQFPAVARNSSDGLESSFDVGKNS